MRSPSRLTRPRMVFSTTVRCSVRLEWAAMFGPVPVPAVPRGPAAKMPGGGDDVVGVELAPLGDDSRA